MWRQEVRNNLCIKEKRSSKCEIGDIFMLDGELYLHIHLYIWRYLWVLIVYILYFIKFRVWITHYFLKHQWNRFNMKNLPFLVGFSNSQNALNIMNRMGFNPENYWKNGF